MDTTDADSGSGTAHIAKKVKTEVESSSETVNSVPVAASTSTVAASTAEEPLPHKPTHPHHAVDLTHHGAAAATSTSTTGNSEEIHGLDQPPASISRFVDSWRASGLTPSQFAKMFGFDITAASQEMPEDKIWEGIADFLAEVKMKSAPRGKREDINTVDDVVQLLQTSNKIIVLTGAGVSVSCGIPDFRSQGGLYDQVAQEYNLADPQELFDILYFRDDPVPFFRFAKELIPGKYHPSSSHAFIKLLETKGKLLRNYTQNIDTLETVSGITRVINCHGSFATATCTQCGHKYDLNDIRESIEQQQIPYCKAEGCEAGVIKPDITFFHEKLPDEFDNSLKVDRDEVDLVIVMGSSLKVHPVASVIGYLPHSVPLILINREVVGRPHSFDVELLGNCDAIVEKLCEKLQWELPFHTQPPPESSLVKPEHAPRVKTRRDDETTIEVEERLMVHGEAQNELDDLQADAELSVEELMKKYYGGGGEFPPSSDEEDEEEGEGEGEGANQQQQQEVAEAMANVPEEIKHDPMVEALKDAVDKYTDGFSTDESSDEDDFYSDEEKVEKPHEKLVREADLTEGFSLPYRPHCFIFPGGMAPKPPRQPSPPESDESDESDEEEQGGPQRKEVGTSALVSTDDLQEEDAEAEQQQQQQQQQ